MKKKKYRDFGQFDFEDNRLEEYAEQTEEDTRDFNEMVEEQTKKDIERMDI